MDHDPLIGTTVDGRFTVLERIGAGGMGTVYRARQLSVDRDVAIKFINEGSESDALRGRRFEKEARIIARLEDPHTLKLIDFGIDRGRRYLVTELLQGETLGARLTRQGPLPAAEVVRWLRPICDALAEAHEQGVIHRDLKPHNLFLQRIGDREVVRVLDYGIARWAESDLATTTGPLAGSPAYMAPEQARGEEVDGRCDLYALGVVAYECLAGRTPFQARTAALMLVKQLQDVPLPFDELNPPVVVPQALEALVLHLLEKDPADRPSGARALAERLDGLVLTAPPPPVVPAASIPHPTDFEVELARPSQRWQWGVGLTLAVVLVLGLLRLWSQPQPPGQVPGLADLSALAVVLDAGRAAPAVDAARPDAARDAAPPTAVPDAAPPTAAPAPPPSAAPTTRPRRPPSPRTAPPSAAPSTAAAPASAAPTTLAEPPGGLKRVVPPPE